MLPVAVARPLEAALRGLQYGSVHLVIHEGKVVRIERVERFRLTDSSEAVPIIPDQPTQPPEALAHAPQES